MVAYNHSIKFIPELEHNKKVENLCSNVITVRENFSMMRLEDLEYRINFNNNQGRIITLYTDRVIARTVIDQKWAFDVKDVVTFFWSSGELSIDYLPGENFTPELLEYWTLQILLPLFLTSEEYFYFLHAGAVEINNAAILFVAESYGGKSTITDFFIKKGHSLVSDDKVAITEEDGVFLAIPSHSHHRPYRKVEDLGYYVTNMSSSPKTIHAIFVLHRVASEISVSISELEGIEKFKSLQFSSEINLSFLKSQRFENLGDLAKNVAIFKVNVPWDIERLGDVYTAITKHCDLL